MMNGFVPCRLLVNWNFCVIEFCDSASSCVPLAGLNCNFMYFGTAIMNEKLLISYALLLWNTASTRHTPWPAFGWKLNVAVIPWFLYASNGCDLPLDVGLIVMPCDGDDGIDGIDDP